jgi:hypothetical protein
MDGRAFRAGIAGLAMTALLAGCGAAKAAGAGSGGAAGCAPGSATTTAVLTVPEEPDSGVGAVAGACWQKIQPTPITNVVIGTASPAGTSAWMKAAWSPLNLYALVWVQEWPLPASGASLWNSQTVEYYVSGNNQKGGAFGPQDGQFGILVGDPNPHNGTDNLSGEPTALQQVVSGKGYYAELAVPWSMLGVTKPQKGQQYKFDVAVDFGHNSTGKQIAQTMWQGGQNNYQDTSEWGSIQLG